MFCPKCGNANQVENSYCRQCGFYLPEINKLAKTTSPQQHVTATIIISILTAIVSLFLAIMLYANFLGKEDTSWVIYLTGGFLTAMFFWQAQIVYRNFLLKKQIPKQADDIKNESQETEIKAINKSYQTDKLLTQADFENVVPASVIEQTTQKLKIENK
jgi:K+-sensing histidine kinase KdpD